MSDERTSLWTGALRCEASARHESHKDHASSRPLSPDYELIGLLGESKFGEFSGFMPDLERKLGGDKGIDFIVPLRFSVDVKTARKAFHLIHEQGKPVADIYVLASYDDATEQASLIGWEWGAKLKQAPVRDFGHGIVSHYIKANQLRPMTELKTRILKI